MAITILTSRAFDQDIERAMKAAAEGPVFITDRGQPTHILLSIAEYRRLTGQELSIVEALGWPAGVEDIEITFPRSGDLPRAVDLS
ncbi:type II toxin-antitoxin system prevent-host-death family antitoxin [Methylobacterium sp. J-070]|uniref:type II toxin-antitoxin system prevent-host-death family antitoxin n=1 Tax=Methylobacterium sp. J-070 TaxID=2836650 RepID=UPI001FBA370D|nr:type II toxin-antitoxin system prevent-host-death family antitoxin [Methylobacterium sp. J-070]MCJ2052656.1 type II toxin-antitoxin system Phd/YefM family antitoxin [Methylobacterium sp. J-070]